MKRTTIGLTLSGLLLAGSFAARAQEPVCGDDCLISIAREYLHDVAEQDYSRLPWGEAVRYTENNVAMMIGDGFWGAGPSVVGEGLFLPDPSTGNVVWFGITAEHGQAAYHGLRLKIEDQAITEVESYLGREGEPELFESVDGYRIDAAFTTTLRSGERSPRERMIALVDGWYNSRQLNDGKLFTTIADDCERIVNGVDTTSGEHWAARQAEGCRAQLELGLFKPVDRIRARRYPVVDEERGIVVALSLEDHAVRYVDYRAGNGAELKVDVQYPNSRGRLELFRIVDGEISRVEGVSVFLPYYIHSLWRE